MRSVVDQFRVEDRDAANSLSADQRVALALALGQRDLAAFCAAHDPPLSVEEAARLLERQRQVGRQPSQCIVEIIER